MNANKRLGLVPASLFVLVAICPFGHVSGDSLAIHSPKERYYLFEPIVLDITLHLEVPYVRDATDPLELSRQLRRLRRTLHAELRDADRVLCEVMLGGMTFHPTGDRVTVVRASVVELLGKMIPEKNESLFRFWNIPGDYTFVVRDREHDLESNAMPITIVAPEKDAQDAAGLFHSGGIGTWLGLVGSEHSDRVCPTFERLVKDYPETIYGRYARMALVLRRAESARTHRVKMEPGMWSALANDLKEVSALFDPGHPLRSRALYYLAGVQRAPDVGGDPKETIMQLLSETDDGQMTRMAREFLDDMVRGQRERTGPVEVMPANQP